jgi:hypothetical protein
MRSRHPVEHEETFGRRGERRFRGRRPSGEEAVWDEADEEQAESPRPKGPSKRRRRIEMEDDEFETPPNRRAPWLPPARRLVSWIR